MRIALYSAAILLLISQTAVMAQPGPAPVFDWTAYPEAGDPGLVNPAGYSFMNGLGLRLGYSLSDSSFEGFDRVSLELPGAGISGWWEDDQDLRKFTLSSSLPLLDGMASLGAGYTWYDPTVSTSPYSGRKTLDVGMIVRPLDWFSLGLVRRGGMELDGLEDVDPTYRAGVGIRPLGRDLTITADVGTGEDLDDFDFSAGAEFRPMDGLALRAGAGEDRVSLGLDVEFGHSGISYGAVADGDLDYSSSRGELTFGSSPRENIMSPGNIYVRFKPGEYDEMRQRSFLGPVTPCFTEAALALMRIAGDPSVSGIIVDITQSPGSPAQTEELRNIFQYLRNRGKKVYFYLEEGSTGAYYLASCGDGIWMHPAGHVMFSGLSSHSFFLRDFLDSVGIYPDFQHIGDYKSASDMLTRSDMSDADRRATTVMLQSMQDQLDQGVAQGRGFDDDELRAISGDAAFTAQRALEAGLVDGICYRDEVAGRIGSGVREMSLEDYTAGIPSQDEWGPQGHVAVVTATGFIERGRNGSSFPFGRVMGSESVCDALKQAASQPGVRAIVLRIDSGGGDALASADMYHAVMEIRKNIPVIVSMGGVAASGGYYMACGADRIFADNMTITGSIGIISGKFAFGGMLDSLGINMEEISTGPMAGMYTPFRKFTDPERQRVIELMHDGYDLFVQTVADGRDMTYEEVDSIGRGRVWAGSDALDLGLVDQIGGVADAVMYAASMGGLDTNEIPQVRIYPTPSFPGSITAPGLGVTADMMDLLGDQQYMYLMRPLELD